MNNLSIIEDDNYKIREVKKNNNLLKEFSPDQIDLIKQTVCKGATDSELQFFLCVCVKTGLDPFMKQIYSIPRSGQRTIQVSIDGSRSIADRTNRYMPGRKPNYSYNEKGELFSATAYVKKMASDGSWHEVEGEALFSEYNPGNNPIWKKMPHAMLSKCAEAIALRKSFPSHLSGIYTDDEMQQANNHSMIEDRIIDIKQVYISKDQKQELIQLMNNFDIEFQNNFLGLIKTLDKVKASCLEEIPLDQFDRVSKLLKKRLPNKEEEQSAEVKDDN